MTVRICCLLPVALDPVGVWASVFRLNAAGSLAKQYLTDALKTGFDIGHGNGPLLHNFSLFGNLYECDFAIMSDGQAIANVR